jgi:D-3-phosphoglycerate dehydrogenase
MEERKILLVGAKGFWSRIDRIREFNLPVDPVLSIPLWIEDHLCPRVWGVVAADQTIGGEFLDRYPNLKVISRTGTGYDAIDIAEVKARGITVTRVAKLNAEAVAQTTVGYIFALCKNLVNLHAQMLQGQWTKEHESLLTGEMTVGIIGLGQIGRALTRKLHHLGFGGILGWTRRPDRPEILDLVETTELVTVDLDRLLRESDVVVVALALTDDTRHLLSREKLALMRPSSYLVNVCRGAVVDETALAEAVATERIAGVALDVFSDEPPTGSPFEAPYVQSLIDSARAGRQVILTPHCAGKTTVSVSRISRQVMRDLASVWAGDLTDVEVV